MVDQVGICSKRRDAEVPKLRPVAELRTEIGVNERAGEGADPNLNCRAGLLPFVLESTRSLPVRPFRESAVQRQEFERIHQVPSRD